MKSIPLRRGLNFDMVELERMVKDVIIPYEQAHPLSEDFPMEVVHTLHSLKLFHLIAPKQYGGQEASVQELVWVVRKLAYGSASFAATFIGNMLGLSAVVLYGNEDLRNRICKQYESEKTLWSFAMTEGEVGSDLVNIRTTATRTKDGFVLNGEKNFITNATYSSHLAVFANLKDENGKSEGVSCFYIPGNTPGLERGPKMTKVGWKKANTGTLLFKNAFIPAENLLGQPGHGLRILTHCLNRSKTLLGASACGISDRALELASQRMLTTERFGKPLLDQSAIRHILARLHTQLEAAWLLTCSAAIAWDSGQDAVKESSMAKLFGGNTATEVATKTMELFGARGLFNDYEISRLFYDAKAVEIVEGPSLVQELLIAKAVLPKAEKKAKTSDPFILQSNDLKKAS